jgi:hypothetical protein
MQKTQGNLQTQLESYSVASKGMQVPRNWKSGGSVLATVAGSALALATNANAGIIYSGIQNVTATRPAGIGTAAAGFTVGGAPWHVSATNFQASRRSTALARLHESPGNGEAFMFTGPFNVKKLASGAVISAGQSFISRSFPLLRRKNNFSFTGQFLNSSTGFAGIKFNQGGNTLYGWIRLHVNIGPQNAVSVTAIDWAYNDVTGQSIVAGQGIPTAAPEPSTAAMALLAAGSAGVLAWRRRRRQVAA